MKLKRRKRNTGDRMLGTPTCEVTGKDRLTRRNARKRIKRMMNRGQGRLEAYRCPHCGACHVGNRVAYEFVSY